jgi:hypothetical protein
MRLMLSPAVRQQRREEKHREFSRHLGDLRGYAKEGKVKNAHKYKALRATPHYTYPWVHELERERDQQFQKLKALQSLATAKTPSPVVM